MESYVIDRFEGKMAVLEAADGRMHDCPLSRLPAGARPGDVLRRGRDGRLTVDAEETARRRAEIRRKMNGLFE